MFVPIDNVETAYVFKPREGDASLDGTLGSEATFLLSVNRLTFSIVTIPDSSETRVVYAWWSHSLNILDVEHWDVFVNGRDCPIYSLLPSEDWCVLLHRVCGNIGTERGVLYGMSTWSLKHGTDVVQMPDGAFAKGQVCEGVDEST